MIKLKTTESRALAELQRIPNATCQAEIPTHWHILEDGTPSAQSICWLFCWATPDVAGAKAAEAARRAFDAILDHTYVWLERRLPLTWARQARDTDHDIEPLFRKLLDRA